MHDRGCVPQDNLRDKEQVFDGFVSEVLERLRAPAHAALDARVGPCSLMLSG